MRTHTSDFKDNIKVFGRELDSIITYEEDGEDVTLSNEEINSISLHYEGSILKSVMKQLDIDSNIEIPVGTEINYQFGVKVRYADVEDYRDNYDYIDYGNYIVYEIEKQEDTNSYKITCYDKMLYAMKDYEDMEIVYPITIRNYIDTICQHLGITFASSGYTFANYNRQIPYELYLDNSGNSLNYTFRDVFDELAQATASTICINANDELEIRYITESEDTIDAEYLKDVNVNFGEKYGPVNSVVLSRSAESDNVYLKDDASIENDGLCEIKIKDNQIMNRNDRSDYLPDIFAKLGGLEYYLNDFSSTGICYYDICDRYTINIDENYYSCVMLNDEINITQGLEENIYTDMPELGETDYTKADKTDRKINKTYLIVDKQNNAIEGMSSQITNQNEEIASIRIQYNEILSKVSDVADITVSGESSDASVSLEDVNASQPISIKIHPVVENICYLYPSNELYPATQDYPAKEGLVPSDTLTPSNSLVPSAGYPAQGIKYPRSRTLRFTNTTSYAETTDTTYKSYKKYYSLLNDEYTLLVLGTDYNAGDTITGTIYENVYYDWILPTNLWYYNSNNYDELELSYGDGVNSTVTVTRKCKVNSDGTVSVLATPTSETYAYPSSILLTDGDYTVTLLDNTLGYLFVQLMAKNIYTTQFYTKAETNSIISQTASEINLGVSQTLSNYSTTNEMNSAITIKANEINSVVSTKVGNNEVISKINQTAETIKINANKVNLTGYVTVSALSGSGTTTINGSNITTGTIKSSNYVANTSGTSINLSNGVIDTKGFKVSSTGALTASSGTIGGWNITSGYLQKTSGSYSAEIRADSNSSNAIFLIWDNNNNRYNWYVNGNGKMYARNCEINGTVNASSGSFTGSLHSTSGTIGGWSLSSSGLQSSSSSYTVRLEPQYLYVYNHIQQNENRATWYSVVHAALSSSDERSKNTIEEINEEKYDNFYDNLKPKTFMYNKGVYTDYDKTHFGFIAQDVLKNEKETNTNDLALVYRNAEDEYYQLDKQEIIALNTWQIQKLKKQVQEQQDTINKLIERIEKLERESDKKWH